MSLSVLTQGGGTGGESASIFVTGLSETDVVTAVKDGKTVQGKWVEKSGFVPFEIPTMTSDTSPSGSSSFEYSGELKEPAWRAFDGNSHTSAYVGPVSSYPLYLVYDFGDKAVKPDGFYGYAEHAWDRAGQGTGTFTVQLQGSNDGQEWENISDEVVWNDRGLKWNDSSSTEDVNIATEVATEKFYTKFRLAVLSSTASVSFFASYCRIFTFQVTGVTKFVARGHEIAPIKDYGMWSVTATNGEETTTQDVLVDAAVEYEIEMSYILWLYREGDECEEVTGGWTDSNYTAHSNTAWFTSGSVVKNNDSISITIPYTAPTGDGKVVPCKCVGTYSSVDLSKHSTLYAQYSFEGVGYTANVDISNITSSQYIAVALYGNTDVKSAFVSVFATTSKSNAVEFATARDVKTFSGVFTSSKSGTVHNLWLK